MLNTTISELKRRETYTRQWQDSNLISKQKDQQRSSKNNVFDKLYKAKHPSDLEGLMIAQSAKAVIMSMKKVCHGQRQRGKEHYHYCYTWSSHSREFDYNYHSSEENSEEENYTHVPNKRK